MEKEKEIDILLFFCGKLWDEIHHTETQRIISLSPKMLSEQYRLRSLTIYISNQSYVAVRLLPVLGLLGVILGLETVGTVFTTVIIPDC